MEQLTILPGLEAPPPAPRHRCPRCGAGFARASSPARDWAAEWTREIEAHPEDEIKLERYALLLASQTKRRIRIAKVWEDMRGEVSCNLDNGFRAAAARRMMARHPALVGRFTTHDLPGDPARARRGRR